jgi:integrase
MATIRITEKSVSGLRAPTASGKQELTWDAELKGFGVLASGVSTTKTFVAQAKVKGSGLTRRVTIGRCDRLKVAEAREKAREVLATLDLGEDPKAKGKRFTLLQALDAYLKARASLKPRSVDDYRSVFDKYLDDWLEKPLSEITPDMVESRHVSIAADIAAAGRYAGHATANKVMRAFRAVYNFAADRDDALPPNPARRLKRQWYAVPRRERMVRFDQLPAFYAALDSLENKVIADYLRFLTFTGLRRTEAAGPRWSDVDFAANTFSIPAAKAKNSRRLVLPMSDLVRDLLVRRRAIGNMEYVFPAASRSGHIEEPKDAFAAIEAETGIKVSAHDLRRGYATIAESLDIGLLAIKALLNHALPRDVTSGYVIINVERLRAPAQRIADRMRELCGIARPEGENVAPMRVRSVPKET